MSASPFPSGHDRRPEEQRSDARPTSSSRTSYHGKNTSNSYNPAPQEAISRPRIGLPPPLPLQFPVAINAPSPSIHHHLQSPPVDLRTPFERKATKHSRAASNRRVRRLSESSSASITPSIAAPQPASYFLPQPAASGNEARSPATKRPPASKSSHGIDTSSGPPIALITRGSFNKEIARMVQSPGDYEDAQQDLIHPGYIAPVKFQLHRSNSTAAQDSAGVSNTGRKRRDSGASSRSTTRAPSLPGQRSLYSTATMALQHEHDALDDSSDLDDGQMDGGVDMTSQEDVPLQEDSLDHEGDRSGQGSEDLFLNIADSPHRREEEDGAGRVERRRSRRARATKQQSLPSSSLPLQSDDLMPNSLAHRSTAPVQQTHREDASQNPPPAADPRSLRELSPMSHPESVDASRHHYPGLSPHSSFTFSLTPEMPQQDRRRTSITDQVQTPANRHHAYRPSNLHYSTSRNYDANPHIDTPSPSNALHTHSRADGGSSAGSSAAPPTVWDEVEDLKSRIAKLELTRNMPPTSGAAISNSSIDRPRTATTTQTTISSSPKQLRKPSASGSSSDTTELHPTLHIALAKCKTHLSPTLYRSLAAAASDALELAALTGPVGPQGTAYSAASIINGVTVADRQVRRKADNVCRSLTELCIALCDARSSTESAATTPTAALPAPLVDKLAARRASLQQNAIASSLSRETRAATEPPERGAPSRALDRIQARRTSMQPLNGDSSFPDSPSRESIIPSIEDAGSVTPKTASREAQVQSRTPRAGTSLLHTRRTRAGAAADDDEASVRPPSRAATEFSTLAGDKGSRLSANRSQRVPLSRDYTSKHPLPDSPHVNSPPLTQASALRRTSRTEGADSHIPGSALRSAVLDGSRRYGARATPERTLAPDTASIAGSEALRQRVTGLGQDAASKRACVGEGLGRRRSLGRRVRQSTPGATAVGGE